MIAGNVTKTLVPAWLTAAVTQRLTLLLNHVLSREPVAGDRLRPHAGRSIEVRLEAWPAMAPPPPVLRFLVTRAGLLEWTGDGEPDQTPADLLLSVAADNPLRLFAGLLVGVRPQVSVQGDASLAADASWLMDNLRWDVRDDLMRLLGPAAAQQLGRLGAGLADGLREAVRRASAAMGRPPGPGPR